MDGNLFRIEASSKSNARLTRFKIKVPQYVIGHSFDTVFKITNLTGTKSSRLTFEIIAKMDEYEYKYKRHLESMAAGVSYVTAPITWTVLNQGVCTFTFGDIIIAGPTELLSKAKYHLIDINDNEIKPFEIFHKVVTTTPEGVYENWAMIIAAISLFIIAIEKLIYILKNIGSFLGYFV